jgi:acetyl esterase/lipase
MKTLLLFLSPLALLLVLPSALQGAEQRSSGESADSSPRGNVRVLTDMAYKQGDALTEYEKERCKLDVYLPGDAKNFATLVWFHGGGLTQGDKGGTKDDSVKTPEVARSLAAAGIAVVAPNYRLSPKATYPSYIQDAAAAVAWVRQHLAEHGGDPKKVFIGGHSAGGYLALMLGMDAHYLGDVGVNLSDIAGVIPVSGQAMTHYTVRAERGIGKFSITADEAAPVYYARTSTPPFLVLYADHDMVARVEENAYFVAIMKGAGNKVITGQLIADRTHGSIASKIANEGDPARAAILEFMHADGNAAK